MSTSVTSLEELIKTLPPEAQVEVRDFVEFLAAKQRPEALLRFVQDIFIDGSVRIAALQPAEMKRLVAVIETLHLDLMRISTSLPNAIAQR